jgi:hypothetical protein
MLKSLLGMFMKDIIEDSAKAMVKNGIASQVSEVLRKQLIKTIYDSYTRELNYNITQYVKAVGETSVTISSGNKGEDLFYDLQSSLVKLELELEKQGPNSPVLRYLEKRYGRRTTSYVGREAQPAYMSIPGVEVDRGAWSNRPWLNRVLSESPEVGEVLAAEAVRIFETLFPSSEVI